MTAHELPNPLVPLQSFTLGSLFENFSLRGVFTDSERIHNKGLIPLTGPDKNKLQSLVNSPPYSPNFAATGNINPNLRVFMAHFDGTWNDKDKVPPGESKTLVGLLFEETQKQNNPNVDSHYLHGVGTRTRTHARVLFEGATGSGCEDRAEVMHQRLVDQAQKWTSENPDVEIHVHAVGFSRGAATALHFLNLVHERGAIAASSDEKSLAKGVLPGEVKSSAALLDVVATGQEKILNLTVPSTTQAVLHLTAGGEERRHFKVTTLGDRRYDYQGKPTNILDNPEWAEAKGVSAPPYVHDGATSTFNSTGEFIYQRIQQITLAGSRHSDVGGGYVENGIAGVPMYLVRGYQQSLGLPGATPVRPTTKDIQEATAHDSRDRIELTRQNLEAIMGKKSNPHVIGRQIAKEQERPWNGDLLRSVEIRLLNEDGSLVSSKNLRMVVPHKNGAAKPSLKDLALNQILVFDRSEKGKKSGEESFKATQENTFEFVDSKEKRLLFKGVRIDDSGHDDSIFKSFIEQGETKGLQLLVQVNDQRLFCPIQKANQIVTPGATLKLPKEKDPWPESVQEAIRFLNDRTHVMPNENTPKSRLTSKEAAELLSSTMAKASLDMGKEFPAINRINFKVSRDDTNPEKNTVGITAYSDDNCLLMSARKKAEGPLQASMRHRLKELAEGLNCMVKLLYKAGYHIEGYEAKMDAQKSTRPLLEIFGRQEFPNLFSTNGVFDTTTLPQKSPKIGIR